MLDALTLRPKPRCAGGWRLVAGALLLFAGLTVSATSPELKSLLPAGGQRGTEVEVSFHGERLQDTEEILCYEPGIETVLGEVSNKVVKARFKLAGDCALGEHHVRLRAASGISELRTFFVGPFPVTEEVEPNNEPGKAQKVGMNTTVSGVIKNEDVDCFAVEVKKGQRLSAEVEGMRLGRALFDPRLAVLDESGTVLADVDDTWLGMQDPFVSLIAPKDGTLVIRLRESTYGGSDECQYRLHIGAFPRPTAIFPLGGPEGETLTFTFYSETTGQFTQQVKLPDKPLERFGVFAERDGLAAPTPNWVRVSSFPNVLAAQPNQDREHATPSGREAPVAFNGLLANKGQEDWFRFPAVKGTALEFQLYARRLRSPLDSVVEVFDTAGHQVAGDDDAQGADSGLKYTPTESTNYFVRVRDTMGQGGPEFVYRLEITPVQPELTLKIPEVARNDTQSRQFIPVPRGNRFATLISAKRSNFGSDLAFEAKDLPPGVTLAADSMAKNIDAMPLVFEAATNAALGGRLLDLTATGSNGTEVVTGRFRQNVELVRGPPNDANYYSTLVDKLCVAVTRETPFHLRIVQPQVPLVQAGSMRLEVVAEREPGFDEPIELQMVWNPPGVSSESSVTIAKGATNAFYQLNAGGDAEKRAWKIAVLGHATVDGGPLYVSTQLAELEVASPFVTGKIETLWLNPGKTGKLTVNLQQAKPFDGKATARLAGLPEQVTTSEREFTKDDQEVVFELTAATNCPSGSFRNLFCSVDVTDKGQVMPHNIAHGGILRVTQKAGDGKLAANKK